MVPTEKLKPITPLSQCKVLICLYLIRSMISLCTPHVSVMVKTIFSKYRGDYDIMIN